MRKLAGLHLKFNYKKGADNKVANALSRVAVHLNDITAVIPIWIQEVVNSYHNDTAAADML
jgi:transposase InsO family protein